LKHSGNAELQLGILFLFSAELELGVPGERCKAHPALAAKYKKIIIFLY